MTFDPNPLYYQMSDIVANNKDSEFATKIYNEGGSRSSKTWDTYHLLYTICSHNLNRGLDIYVFRDTLVNARDLTFKDFQKFMKVIKGEVVYSSEKSKPEAKVFGNNIYFRGLPADDDEGFPTDIIFFNEMLEMSKTPVDGLRMRCGMLVIGDWNPKFTKHWCFDFEGQTNTHFTRSTYLNNKHLKRTIVSEIESTEPWETGSYSVTKEGIIMYEGEPVTDKNQPPPNVKNIEQQTADLFRWKVYGLGLRGAMKGLVHPYHIAIDKFPDIDFIYANDFGFTKDPNALVKFAQQGRNIYLELLCYTPIDTASKLIEVFEALDIPKLKPIICDSADRFVSADHGVQLMVKGLRAGGYSASKVSKTKNVTYWIGEMNGYVIHIVSNKFYRFAKSEAENYMWKSINGIELNTPEDGNDHFWNASRYAFMKYNQQSSIWG